jgi:16S rRNA (guanine966-N2)-methyltransferase
LRIIAGRHRGRVLAAPPGLATRPSSARLRQALFDMLWHAPWGGREVIEGADVLDAFAGSGALGIEALSRGAARVAFLENDSAALACVRQNLAACREEALVFAADATRPPRAAFAASLVFADPPYAQGFLARAVPALRASGWIADGALLAAEIGAEEAAPDLAGAEKLAERAHGAGRIWIARLFA